MSKNIQYIRSVLCGKSILDSNTNNVSLIEILEQINIEIKKELTKDKSKNVPLVFPFKVDLVSFWKRDDVSAEEKIDLKIDIIDPKGKVLNSFNNTSAFTKGTSRLRFFFRMNGLAVTEEGTYLYRLSYKAYGSGTYKQIDELELEIRLKQVK